MKKLLVGLLAAAAIIAACSSNDTTSAPPVVASVTMVPTSDSGEVGDTMLQLRRAVQLAAVLKDAAGNVLSVIQTGQTVDWTSSAPTVATVGRDGIVKTVATGSATITAAIEGQSGTSVVKVLDTVFVATVSVSPAPDSVIVDSTLTLEATPTNASGDTLVARMTIWTSSDTTVAIVTDADSLGVLPGNTAVIQGVAAGTVTITATIAGVSGTDVIKVKP
jgi:uncharacterized protein YjdB